MTYPPTPPPTGGYPPPRRAADPAQADQQGAPQGYPRQTQPQQQGYPQQHGYPQQTQPQQGYPQQQGYSQRQSYPTASRPVAAGPVAAGNRGVPGGPPGSPGAHAAWSGSAVVPQQWARSRGSGSVGTWAALGILGLSALWGMWIVLSNVGTAPAAVGFVAALVPLIAVVAVVMWLDRWEPEPRIMLLLAFLWGAGPSVVIAYFGNTAVAQAIYDATGDPGVASVLGSVISAPVLEELAKGTGVLLIFLLRRSYFDGVVDGIVYAAIVAAGFAFTENILYFGRYIDSLVPVFVQRGVMSPFAHILFTACTGIALGLASRSRSRRSAWWFFPLGLLSAMALHALWNGSASLEALGVQGVSFFLLYAAVQVPLFVAAIMLVVWLRRQESAVIRDRLGEYAAAGWFAPHEVAMVSSLRQRSQARTWAARVGPTAAQAMRTFIKDATSLAYLRQRAVSGRADLRTHATSETDLLGRIKEDRQTFLAAAGVAGAPRA
ncbi:PrsW family intramembrane metalloprotease [Miniimonas arenae]|uniref:PrsW family intramembrane metalloprotease n=1 Tax=Miniimonas arenae TaxID=676201 RepID=A0A5C5BF24_9MICO|nr:PrsW family intramembrane metalloprotease [Miniimonas arenae]TNU75855.1 PrsW family intramembrane metalloprotease [Miniimonas arenae]